MQYIKISLRSEQKKFRKTGEIVRDGGVIVYPTDTIYGFGCSPANESAVERIYQIKGRNENAPLLILLDHQDRLQQWCEEIPEAAIPLIAAWPAPLTIIMPVKKTVPPGLTRGLGSLGFRVPAAPLIRNIAAACGGSITSTSVNRSGQPPMHDPGLIGEEFAEELDLILDAGILPRSEPSTIVSCLDNKVSLLRSGAWKL